MGEAQRRQADDMATVFTELEDAIEAIEKGKVGVPIRLELANDVTMEATHESELDGLLQRARGLRLITMIANGETVERPASMRKGKPALHPEVEDILDALKRSG